MFHKGAFVVRKKKRVGKKKPLLLFYSWLVVWKPTSPAELQWFGKLNGPNWTPAWITLSPRTAQIPSLPQAKLPSTPGLWANPICCQGSITTWSSGSMKLSKIPRKNMFWNTELLTNGASLPLEGESNHVPAGMSHRGQAKGYCNKAGISFPRTPLAWAENPLSLPGQVSFCCTEIPEWPPPQCSHDSQEWITTISAAYHIPVPWHLLPQLFQHQCTPTCSHDPCIWFFQRIRGQASNWGCRLLFWVTRQKRQAVSRALILSPGVWALLSDQGRGLEAAPAPAQPICTYRKLPASAALHSLHCELSQLCCYHLETKKEFYRFWHTQFKIEQIKLI